MNSVTVAVVMVHCDLGCHMFWGTLSRWQYILIATFSSFVYVGSFFVTVSYVHTLLLYSSPRAGLSTKIHIVLVTVRYDMH